MNLLVLYHGDWDGIVSAWLITQYHRKKLLAVEPVEIKCQAVKYGRPPPATAVNFDHVYVVDFCWSAEQLDELAIRNRRLTVIDHHKTAIDKLYAWTPLGNTTAILRSESAGRPVAACALVWEHIAGREVPMPELAQYVADRDVWLFRLPDSREVNAAIQTYSPTLENCDILDARFCTEGDGIEGMVRDGKAVVRANNAVIDSAIRNAQPMTLPIIRGDAIVGGARGMAVNTPVLISDTAGRLAEVEGVQFGACWFWADGKWIVSLRSRDDFDVAALAQGFGGGGHPQAAGFKLSHSPARFLEEVKT